MWFHHTLDKNYYMMKYLIITSFVISVLVFIISCSQERIIFYPEKLPKDYKFFFAQKFEEIAIQVDKKTSLNGVLFSAENSKGLVFYLHGNAGSNRSWGEIADVYLENGYSFFILDYRGYGKSEGKITSEKQLFNDIQIAYDVIKKRFPEERIIIIGYSIGTGPATWLASKNKSKLLILKAPYYNLPYLAHQYIKIIPSFLIRYKFRTDKYIQNVKCPVIIFHGNKDEIINTESSYKLQKLFKPQDSLIILKGQFHNGINDNIEYKRELKKILGAL
jgi:alpha-beta hydrolase superfamily lysophospholipase